jgi:hypothetical protein
VLKIKKEHENSLAAPNYLEETAQYHAISPSFEEKWVKINSWYTLRA